MDQSADRDVVEPMEKAIPVTVNEAPEIVARTATFGNSIHTESA